MNNRIEIKTRTPPNLAGRQERVKNLSAHLAGHTVTMDELKILYRLFVMDTPRKLKKPELIPIVAAAMIFDNEQAFIDWFCTFPVLTQNLMYRLAFDYFVPVPKLEAEFGLSLVHNISRYDWEEKWVFHTELGLNFLHLFNEYGQVFAVVPYAIRIILVQWLLPPPELIFENCTAGDGNDAGSSWNNSARIAESLPLLYNALRELIDRMKPPDSPYRCVRGFKKKNADELRVSSAFKPFDVPNMENGVSIKTSYLVPDSADLTARFILAMKNFSIDYCPRDGHHEVKALVSAFFSEKSQYKGYMNPPDRHSLEYNVLFDHISKPSEYFLSSRDDLLSSRRVFKTILMVCAKNGGTFDADKTAQAIYRTMQDFTFYYHDIERYLNLKGETITADGITYSSLYYNEFYPHGIMTYYLLVSPLFKAYCYLFAALGILEISQQTPSLRLSRKEKEYPLSPYDSLKTFKVTEFGKWCLGLTDKRPECPKVEYRAIADKELLLVTVQGTSLERTIYLDKIGRKLGTNRWRISPDSFISGCVEKNQIQERIDKFKALIDPEPAPHWLALFDNAVNRAGLFDKPLNDMLVYRLPADRSIAEELLQDNEFRQLIRRAEGGLLVISEKNRKKFYALLNAHGISVFDDR
jgi:hypothetical protein